MTAPVSELTLDALAAVLIANEPKHGAECQNRGCKRQHLLRVRFNVRPEITAFRLRRMRRLADQRTRTEYV